MKHDEDTGARRHEHPEEHGLTHTHVKLPLTVDGTSFDYWMLLSGEVEEQETKENREFLNEPFVVAMLNASSLEQLKSIPGISEEKARTFIERRPYNSAVHILNALGGFDEEDLKHARLKIEQSVTEAYKKELEKKDN